MAKRDTRLDAIKYQEMLKQQQAKKRATEDQAKEEVDKLSKLVAAIRQMGSQGGEAEGELDKANAALRDKNWTASFNSAQTGLIQGHNTAAKAARQLVSAGEQKAVEVENLGVVSEELTQLIQEARSLLEDGRYLEAIRKGQEVKTMAIALGRAQMEDAIASVAELLEDDRRKGVDTRAPEAILEKARSLMAAGDVNFQQVTNLVTDQAQTARESALRGDVEGQESAPQRGPLEAEDRDSLKRAVEESFQLAEREIKTARQLKANVAAAEKEFTRAKSAFDSDDLKTARSSTRRAIVAAMAAARKSVNAMVQDAAAEVRRLRLAGANVTEPRKILATAKARAAEGSFGEAAELVSELLKRTAETREQQQRLIKDVEQAFESLVKITTVGIAPTDAMEALEEARNYARRGDVDRAQAALKRATQVGRDFWNGVVAAFIKDMRDLILESKESGGQIAPTRGTFNLAKQKLDEGKFQEAMDVALSAARNLQGVDAAYHEALNLAASKYFEIELAFKLGLAKSSDADILHDASALRAREKDGNEKSGPLYQQDLKKHRETLEALRWEFRAEQEQYGKLARRTLELENEVEEGKKIGTDMTNAEELLFNARTQITKRKLQSAEDFLKQITADITERKDARIEELLRDADTDIKHLRAGGVYVDDVDREVREARSQHANHNYEVAVDLIQDAISTALERQQDLEAARREVLKAESLIEQGAQYAADLGVASTLLEEARSLSREHDDRDARAIAAQAVSEAQTSLAKFIDLILEETQHEIERAESEYGEFPESRQRLHEARRLHEQGETGDAIVQAREISEGLRQEVQTIQEIRQKIELVESYIGWTGQYSKTVVMPHKLLEHAKERLEHFSLEAAREAVNEALQKAEDAQKNFIRQVHGEVFELVDEYEEKGVQLTAARNLMMQAQGLLETKNFQESYKVAVQALELARKAFDIFQRTQRAVGELETDVKALNGFGIDTAGLTGLLEKASVAFASEDYDTANTAVTQAQQLAPKLRSDKLEAVDREVAQMVDTAKQRRGLNHKRFREAYDHCKETRAEGEVGLALEMLIETRRDLDAAIKESDAIEALLSTVDARLEEFEGIGLDLRALSTSKSQAFMRLDGYDLKEAMSALRRGLRQADKDAAAFCASRVDALLSEALALRLRGYPTEGVIRAAQAGSGALLDGDYAKAVATVAAAGEALKGVPPRVDGVRRYLSRGRLIARLLKDGFGQEAKAAARLEEADRLLKAGEVDEAERLAQEVVEQLIDAIEQPTAERLDQVDASLAQAKSKGVATEAVAQAVRMGRTALEQALPEAAVHWARVGAAETRRAVEDSKHAQEALFKGQALINDAADFGASTGPIEAKVEAMRTSVEKRRHRLALVQFQEVQAAWRGAKKARVDSRKSEVLQSLQRAAKLGLPQEGPRKELANAERLVADGQFDEALKAIGGLEGEVGTSLARHDELASEFEEVSDLMESFADLKIDFATAVEGRDRAKAAIERFQLKEAEELTALLRKGVNGTLATHGAGRIQELTKAAGAAKADGMVIREMDELVKAAETELSNERFREALVMVDRGLEKLGQHKLRHGEVQKLVKEADSLLARATPLKMDLADATASLEGARERLGAGEYDESKVEADYAVGNLRAKIASEVERRIEEMTSRIEEAASLGIGIEPERAALKKAREAAGQSDFAKLLEASDSVETSIERKLADRTTALEELDRARQLLDQMGPLEIPEAEFEAEVAAAEKLVASNQFAKAGPAAQALSKKLADQMRTRVDTAILETGNVLRIFTKSGIDAGSSGDELDRARKLMAAGDFHEAYQVARAAEITAYEAKDKHDRARQVIHFFEDNLGLAAAAELDASDLDTLRMQALDAFEFQSYEEAAATALEALGKLNTRLKEAYEVRVQEAARRADELEMAGASVGILRQELELASKLVGNDDYFSADISLGGSEKRIERLASDFAGAKDAAEALAALINVADVLGVEAKKARLALGAVEGIFEQGRYTEARQATELARRELSQGCATEVKKRIDAAGEVLTTLEGSGVPPGVLGELLLRAAHELIAEDYVAAFGTAREVIDGTDRQRRSHAAAREAVQAARRMLRVAEGLEAEADAGRQMLSEAELLLRSGDVAGSQTAAGQSLERLAAAAADRAGTRITEAEQNLEQFSASGVRCPPAEDCLVRSRQALELSDFLGSIRFAELSSRVTEGAKRQMEEAQRALKDYRRALERAEGLLDLTPQDQAAAETASRALEEGQVRRATEVIRSQRNEMEARAGEQFSKMRADVEAVASSIAKLQGDPGPALNELALGDKAREQGKGVEALEALISTRALARESLVGLIQIRVAEGEALIDQVEAVGVDGRAAREAVEALRKVADDPRGDFAVQQTTRFGAAMEGAGRARTDGVAQMAQKTSEHRFFRTGRGAQEAAQWKTAATELRSNAGKGDLTRTLESANELERRVQGGMANVISEKLVEIDAIRDAHMKRRDPTPEEQALYERVAAAADRGRADLAEFEAADKLDQLLRDWASKFVTDSVNQIKREMMTFEDKAAVETLKGLVAAVEKTRGNTAHAVARTYEVLDGARELIGARAQKLLKEADRQLAVARSIDLDAATLQDFVDRAHSALQEGNVAEAVEFAENVMKESARLQEAHVGELLKTVIAEFQAAQDGKAKAECKRLLEETRSALRSKDFEAAYDFSRRARELLVGEARQAAEGEIQGLLESVAKLEAQGVDCTSLRDAVEEVRTSFDMMDAAGGRKRLVETASLVRQRHGEWEQAAGSIAKLEDRMDRATSAKIELGALPGQLEGARRRLRDAEFAAASKEVAAIGAKLNELLALKIKAMITSAQAKIKHNKNLEIDSRAAEEMLASALKLMAARDVEGAFDAAVRAISEADAAKEITKQLRVLGEQGTELLERAAEAGIALSPDQEQIIFDAAKGRLKHGMKVAALEGLIQSIREQVGAGGPRLDLNFTVSAPPVVNRTNNAVLEIRNLGDEPADEVAIAFSGEANVKLLGAQPGRLEPGDRQDIEIQVISRKMGNNPIRVLVTYKDPLGGAKRRRTDRRWVTFFDPTDTTNDPQFVRHIEKCLVCVGDIGTGEVIKVCECQSTFHLHCAAGVSDCPKCGRSLGDS